LLIGANRLQRIPSLIVALIMGVIALIVYGAWTISHGTGAAQAIALICAGLNGFDWLALWSLPRAGRSYGPEKPPALALGILRGGALIVLGVLPAPLWIGVIYAVGLSVIAVYATWIEPFRLGVTVQTYQTPKWKSGTPPLRLLHIGDLHIERITRRERRLNQLIRELQPDVIVFSGDFVNFSYSNDPLAKAHIREIIGEWTAPLGVYCVAGTYTVESSAQARDFTVGLDNLHYLEDEWVCVDTPAGELHILGMLTTHILDTDRPKTQGLMDDSPKNADSLKFMLTHAPDVAPEADAAGYDLYVCGHTHGGQLRLPFFGAIFSGSALGLRFVMGRYDLERMTLYTTRGVGMEGMGAPRARFLCPPEIVLWEINGTG
jgi:predicted MPP superfamily phosphohydrolase